MAILQDTYFQTMEKAVEGQPCYHDFSADTRIVETDAGIPFGRAVGQGVNDKGAVIGAAAAADFVGISIADLTVAGGEDLYADTTNIGVLYRGDIWVKPGAPVVAGDDVSFVATTGVLSSAAAGGSQFVIPGARWMTSAGAGELAICRLSGSLPSA